MGEWVPFGGGAGVVAAIMVAARWIAARLDRAKDHPGSTEGIVAGVVGRVIADRLLPVVRGELAHLTVGQASIADAQATSAVQIEALAETVRSLDGRLTWHLDWEERRDRADVEHRKARQEEYDALATEVRDGLAELRADVREIKEQIDG